MQHIYLTITFGYNDELLIVKPLEGFDQWLLDNPFLDNELKKDYQAYKAGEQTHSYNFSIEYKLLMSATQRIRFKEGQ